MPKSFTERGFAIYDEFADTKGNTIRVQESSSATDHCVWVFASNNKGDFDSPHVNVEQAKMLINALQEFVSNDSE